MQGNFGEYYLTEGYFFCFNPFGFEDHEQLAVYLLSSTR